MILGHLIFLGVGRLLLSWLPPGRLGGHRAIELPATLGASYLLGAIAFVLQVLLAEALGTAPGKSDIFVLLLPWAVLFALRIITLPGYFVAGAEPRHEARTPVFWGLVALAVLVVLTLGVGPHVVAFALVASHLLWQGRRAPAYRAGLILLFLATSTKLAPAPEHEGLGPYLGLAGGFLIPWIRRNDFRAATLSGLMLVGHFLASGAWLLVVGGLAVLNLVSRPRQRPFAWKVSAVTLGLCASAFVLGREGEHDFATLSLPSLDPSGAILALVVFVGSTLYLRRAEPWSPGQIEEPVREGWALTALLSLSVLFEPLASAPLAVFWAGTLLLPVERPDEA